MDDIARSLSISKKTIYQYFKDKDEIVELALLDYIDRARKEYEHVFSTGLDPIGELQQMTQCMRKNFQNTNPVLIYDIQKYHPGAWEHIRTFKCNHVMKMITSNLERGKLMGYYRSDIDAEVLAILRMGEVEMAFDHQFFPSRSFDFRTVQLQLMDHFVNGIVTDKGRELLEKQNSEKNVNNN